MADSKQYATFFLDGLALGPGMVAGASTPPFAAAPAAAIPPLAKAS